MHGQACVGHVGGRKTLERIHRFFWWPTMRQGVYQYVTHCDLYQRNEGRTGLADGLLQPLPVPNTRWQVCTLDITVKLHPH
jgi:hypothetical protein